jgi:hypothetical protein
MLNNGLSGKIYINQEVLIILLGALCFFNYYLSIFILFFGPKKLEKIASIGFISILIILNLVQTFLVDEPIFSDSVIFTQLFFYFFVIVVFAWFYYIKIFKI